MFAFTQPAMFIAGIIISHNRTGFFNITGTTFCDVSTSFGKLNNNGIKITDDLIGIFCLPIKSSGFSFKTKDFSCFYLR